MTITPSTQVRFGTKAETLAQLRACLRSACVLDQVCGTVGSWRTERQALLVEIGVKGWFQRPVIVRSSTSAEDRASASLVGHYLSVAGVVGAEAISEAIDRVLAAYFRDGTLPDDAEQFFIQPLLEGVAVAGVAFGRDPNSMGPYIVVNYDDRSGSTSTVTSGGKADLRTFYYHWRTEKRPPGILGRIIELMHELRLLFETDHIDVEFAALPDGTLYLLQARQLFLNDAPTLDVDGHAAVIASIAHEISHQAGPQPDLLGKRSIFGVMPDWNPAEIIGIRPRPLALSLYRELVTDAIWAQQRTDYGYRDLRGFPLMLDFYGLPYVDVRVSFNSFIPSGIDQVLAARLVDYYLERLSKAPELHDKVEFRIVFSCYTLDLPRRLAEMADFGFAGRDCRKLAESLRRLTNRIINCKAGLWHKDLASIQELEGRQSLLENTRLDRISRIYRLLEDCRRYGTLPFAGLARVAFVAAQLLDSMVSVGELSTLERSEFMNSVNTISSKMKRDFAIMPRSEFLMRYGHLRPGTYDILSRRYDEAPDQYFAWSARAGLEQEPVSNDAFVLSPARLRQIDTLLAEHELKCSALEVLRFIKDSIEAREMAKFVFTRTLSNALAMFADFGREYGFSIEDCAHAEIDVIRDLYLSRGNPAKVLGESIERGYRRYHVCRRIVLPPLIEEASQAWSFQLPPAAPNYITQKRAIGTVASVSDELHALPRSILMITSADPGYDWIFSHPIAGFITMYGGINSHMSIRAAELGLPAVIGAGETLFNSWQRATVLEIDCANQRVTVMR